LAAVHRVAVVLLLAGLIAACAGSVPRELGTDLPAALSAAEVQAAPRRHLGEEVRWGGEILGLRNGADATEVEVFARPLFRDGEPKPDGGERVRFIARVRGFLDPAEFLQDRRITVRGRLVEPLTRPVGEYLYRYPVVAVEVFHLWPEYRATVQPVWVRDPYFGPWRPYPSWPYGW